MKKNEGITLVALVVTVIILLIIAGVAISMITGNDGLFTKANDSGQKYKNTLVNEKEIVDQLLNEIDTIGNNEGEVPIIEPIDKLDAGLLLYTRFNPNIDFEDRNYTNFGNTNIQISSTAKNGTGSCFFSGTTGQRLNIKNNDLAFKTDDFTIEFWANYPEQTMTYAILVSDDGNSQLQFFLTDDYLGGNISLRRYTTTLINTGVTYTQTKNQWVHYALVRKDGIFTIYQNGNKIGETDEYKTLEIDMSSFSIGGNSSTNNTPYKGYIDDIAVLNYAKYTTNFTPGTIQKNDNTILYSDFDSDLTSKVIAEQNIVDSISNKIYTKYNVNSIKLSNTKYQFGNGSCKFSGIASQRLNVKNNELDFRTDDFTIEFWANYPEQTMTYAILVSDDGNSQLQFFLTDDYLGGNISLRRYTTTLINTGVTYIQTKNQWVHYALVRKDGIFTIYQNGNKIGETDEYKTLEIDMSSFSIGGNSSTKNTAYKGYIDDLAIFNYAKYNSDFTVTKLPNGIIR